MDDWHQEVEIAVPPDHIHDLDLVGKLAIAAAKEPSKDLEATIIRRSIDARKKPVFRLQVSIHKSNYDPLHWRPIVENYGMVTHAPEVIIIGAGPAGYFAALECLELGLRPIVLDRGKDVRSRRRDLRAIQQTGTVNPDSNYCFGEGGAGTYSDGKLYTRAKKRGDVRKVLQILVEHGASRDILIDAHPHIGSNKLPKIIAEIRHTIESHGGTVHFDAKVDDLMLRNGQIHGIKLRSGDRLNADKIILATGHSARDIFDLLEFHQLGLASKPFAMGVRIEHPQENIDLVQYGQKPRHVNLPAASYRLATEVQGVAVYSFCMCPGGLIVPAATAPGELVVNGMSLSRRDSLYANAGIVASVSAPLWKKWGYHGVLGGVKLQSELEQLTFSAGGGAQQAPAQRVTDFIAGKKSQSLPATSYIPGVVSAELHKILPSFLVQHLQQGLIYFNRRMKGFVCHEAQLVALESRTSSPVRIPRDPKTMMHPQCDGLFPCGEGAGYAGGIVSAALDGQKVVRALARSYKM